MPWGWILIRCCGLNTVRKRINQIIALRTIKKWKKLNLNCKHISLFTFVVYLQRWVFQLVEISFSLGVGHEKVWSIQFVAVGRVSFWSCYGTPTNIKMYSMSKWILNLLNTAIITTSNVYCYLYCRSITFLFITDSFEQNPLHLAI